MNNLFKDEQPPGSPTQEQAGPGRENTTTDKGTYMEKAAIVKSEMVAASAKKQQEEMIQLAGDLDSLDWKKIKPHIMAQILTKIPYRGKRDEPPYYLSPIQALIFAMEAYRMNLSPLSNQCFFNRDSNKVNATLEGKKTMARDQGYNFGPPKFTRTTKPFTKAPIVGFKEDIGYHCSIGIKDFEDRAEYTAWLSEWHVSSSPVWREKPEHMLMTRAHEKAISMASGVGSSEIPSEHDLQPPEAGKFELPQIEVIDSNQKGELKNV